MTLQKFMADVLAVLAPAFLVAITALSGWLIETIRKRVKDARLREVMETVSKLVATGVADAYQTVVAGLKDPDHPGVWDKSAAEAVKDKVLREVKEAAPALLDQLSKLGIEKIDSYLHRLVEEKVVQLQASNPPVLLATPIVAEIKKEGGES